MLQIAMDIRNHDAQRNALAPLRPRESELAFRDGMTGLYNYRLLEQLFGERWEELVALCDGFAVVILDLDLFKDVNDRYGHLSGDEVLRATARILQSSFRAGDLVFRYGGDEFVVLLPGADSAEASMLGERARSAMLEAELYAPEEHERIEIPVSFSIGVATWPADGENGKAVLARADERLYAEKQKMKQRLRRRRALVASVVAALLAVVAAGLLLLRGTPEGEAPRAPVAAPAAPPVVTVPGGAEEEKELRARIEELKAEIERLTKARQEKSAPGPAVKSGEIEALQAQVRELSERLETRTPVPAGVAADAPRPASERPLPDGGDRTPAAPDRPATAAQAPATPEREVESTTRPRLLEPVIPRYPDLARQRRLEASIEFRVVIDEAGKVVSATPVSPSRGFGFDEAARAAAYASRWSPGTRGGRATPMTARLVVHFRIQG